MNVNETDINKVGELVALLLERTREELITWTEGRHEQYVFSTSSTSVSIDSLDKDNNLPIAVTILNSDGSVVMHYVYDMASQSDPRAGKALELYRLVHRTVMGVDETLDALLLELKRMPPF